uniref:formate dehydrogenase subunit delta n=1 Tax=Stappia sp. TaxID=1870903 RepID=UPI003BAB6639
MKPEKLVYMANQIATFFTSKPHDEGVEGVAGHINKFWEPRMRAQLFEVAESESDAGLHELVREALGAINRPDPARFATPAERAAG